MPTASGAAPTTSASDLSTAERGAHTLVIYAAAYRGGRITVLTPVAQEPEGRGCCDTRSVLWNEISRGLAHEDLAKARVAVEGEAAVDLGLLPFSGRGAAAAVVREACARAADEVVLADARAVPLGRLERRRLRRASPVPVRP